MTNEQQQLRHRRLARNARIVKAYQAGTRAREIADEENLSFVWVHAILKQASVAKTWGLGRGKMKP